MNHHQRSASRFASGLLASGLLVIGLSACNPNVTIGALPSGATPASGVLSTLAPARLDPGAPMQGAAAIAYADGWVYFASTPYVGESTGYKAEIWRVPVEGGPAAELTSGIPTVYWLAANAADVFIGEVDGSVWRLPAVGGTPILVFHGLGDAVGSAFTITPTDLVLANGDGSIRRAPIGGGSAIELYPPTQGENAARVVADATNVYWFAMKDTAGNGEVKKMPLAGGPATVMTRGRIGSIAVDGDYLYVTDVGTGSFGEGATATGDGTVMRMRIDQSEGPTIIASNQPLPYVMAVDASGAYWGTVWGMPSLNHVNLAGGAVGSISPIQGVMAMCPCADGVCWVDAHTNTVMRYQPPGGPG